VPENFSADRDDPKEIALRFEREGLSKEDSYLLRSAGHLYGNIGATVKKNECRARADLLENKYSEAAREFELAGLVEDALSALWQGQHYADVAALAGRRSEIAKHPYTRMASFLCGKDHAIRGCITLFDNLLSSARANETLRGEIRDVFWGRAIGQALTKTVDNIKGFRIDDASTLADKVIQLGTAGVAVAPGLLAKVLFIGGRYDEVLAVLKSDDGSEMYRHARAQSLIKRESSDQGFLQKHEARYVADHYMHSKEISKAAAYYRRSGDTERALDCLRVIAIKGNSQEIAMVSQSAIDVLIDEGQWSLLIQLLMHGNPRPGRSGDWSKATATNLLMRIQADDGLLRHVVVRMAGSEKLSNADVRVKSEVSEFLAKLFVRREVKFPALRELSWRVAGAAIERAGKDKDALEFYEKAKNTSGTRSEREYADRRWVICKLRQAKREEQQGLRNKASEHRREAERIAVSHQWNEDELADEFPVIDSEQVDAVRAQGGHQENAKKSSPDLVQSSSTEGRVGSISWRFFHARNWINLTSESDGMRARILLIDKRVDSDDVKFADGVQFDWVCEEWGLTVSWPTDSTVEIRHGSDKVEIPFGGMP
jgi:tetratricopeptide (TPR) repeat protein